MSFVLRTARESDYEVVSAAVDAWWTLPGHDTPAARRERVALVPRLWLQHFAGTSLVAERDDEFVGFLIGFHSPDRPEESYIHFVGVRADARAGGLGRALYERFFALCRGAGRVRVRCITSPTNTVSIGFHRAMGFAIEAGVAAVGAVDAKPDYDGLGVARVAFVRELGDR
jgi:ribosomal protein S18 acetylase RimI-like enzyme